MNETPPAPREESTYATSGVDTEQAASSLKGMLAWIGKTLSFRQTIGAARLPIGYFANVVDIGNGMGLAISTDGVGTKVLVAQMMGKYDTVGIDCVAMNVNDIICVGAEPISLVDCISVQEAWPDLLEGIAKGLCRGAELARVTITGGEIAQIRDIIKGEREGYGFDLVATAIGLIRLDSMIVGADIQEGDAIVGLRSSGIHSNGMTLTREVFFRRAGIAPNKHFDELGRTLGEEILEPTRIYVPEIMDVLKANIAVKALAHITGDGFLNLSRVSSDTGFVIEYLPPPHPIFDLIQRVGGIADEEMFQVYNMGIGFCVVVPPADADDVIAIARHHGVEAFRIGRTVRDAEKRVTIEPRRLVSKGNTFIRY
ncbi:MAG: phosphoribosylformylglycinamidine cyclo-ligase [Chloroflexi bacterium]|nr:phosphoribosylformylglycinamidine cyclo-ligase [Chloroflexota bacterium]